MMSVFNGRIIEFPGVIIDRFTVPNCKYGRAFFLSHCHKGAVRCLTTVSLSVSVVLIRSHDWPFVRGTGHNTERKVAN